MRLALCVVVLAAAVVVNGEAALAAAPSPNDTVTFVDSTPVTSAQIRAASTDPAFYSDALTFSAVAYASTPGTRTIGVTLTVTNTSQTAWPANVADSVFLTYGLTQGGTVITPMGWLWSSNVALAPGESGTFPLAVDAPSTLGTYTLTVDLVRGPSTARTLFGAYGNATPSVTFYVTANGEVPPPGGGSDSDLVLVLAASPTSATTGTTVNASFSLTNTSASSQRVTISATLVYTGTRPYQTTSPSTQFTLGAGKKIGASFPFKISSAMPRGTYALTVTATDASGAVSATATLTVR